MAERKSISNKVRFEVFKRDSFKCQYCGQAAPDVVLEVDHINPVSKGGDNNIVNLVTSCSDCNNGKSNILLDDNSVVNKQRAQLEELNDRRNQLQLIAEWREGLLLIEQESVELICTEFNRWSGCNVLDLGKKKILKWLKKYRLPDILEATQTSCLQYLKETNGGSYSSDDLEKAFNMIPRILNAQMNGKPYMKELYYIRGIMRNRYGYVNEKYCMENLKFLYQTYEDTEKIKQHVLSYDSWSQFDNSVELMRC